MNNFDHIQTEFLIAGQDDRTNCFACHEHGTNNGIPFQEYITWKTLNVPLAMRMFMKRNSGIDCASCHNERSFKNLKSMNTFDHTNMDYPLNGKHIEVDCKECHKASKIDPIDFNRWANHHDDYHSIEFEFAELTDCTRCHAFNNWEASRFNHDETAFKLEGEHKNVSCTACHKETKEGELKYTLYQIENFECATCHL